MQVAGDLSSARFVNTRQGFTKLLTKLLQNALLYATLQSLDAFVILSPFSLVVVEANAFDLLG